MKLFLVANVNENNLNNNNNNNQGVQNNYIFLARDISLAKRIIFKNSISTDIYIVLNHPRQHE